MDSFFLINKKKDENCKISQIDFRESLLALGLAPDKVSMDRIYLFYKRYNQENDDMLRYSEFAICLTPVN